jgi:ABC-type glycerol-3-phosphate transport system permease component
MNLLGPAWRRIRFDVMSYVGLAPFLAFALFPFYWMVITSFKADANLYDLKRNPFWFSNYDGATNRPYHKDIIVPASDNEGTIRWVIRAGAHTTRSDRRIWLRARVRTCGTTATIFISYGSG